MVLIRFSWWIKWINIDHKNQYIAEAVIYNDEDKENMEEIIASEKEVKREEMQNNINQYLDNSYLSQMYLGSVTVVGLFIMYRLIRRK